MSSGPNRQKIELRAHARALRAVRDRGAAARESARMGARLSAIELPLGGVIALYAALPGELDPLFGPDDRVALPRVRPGPAAALEFRRAPRGLASTTPGRFGIAEPIGALVPYEAIGALVVPGLLFDRWGHRLGYGGGYYDRTIAALRSAHPRARVIGVAFVDQIASARLPSVATDARLDEVWTAGGTLWLRSPRAPA